MLTEAAWHAKGGQVVEEYVEMFVCDEQKKSSYYQHAPEEKDLKKLLALEPEKMAKLSWRNQQKHGDLFCHLPFSTEIEAASLGGLEGTGRVRQYSLAELAENEQFFGDGAPMKRVLEAITLIGIRGGEVMLKLEGPFSILAMLIPVNDFYRSLYKQPKLVHEVCRRIIGEMLNYARAAFERGVKLFSYADPIISYKLISKKLCRGLCGEITAETLRRLTEPDKSIRLHVCSAVSVGLLDTGLCETREHVLPKVCTYEEALWLFSRRMNFQIMGHGCLLDMKRRLKYPRIYEIKLID